MKKITFKRLQVQSLQSVKGLITMSALLLMSTQMSWAQQPIGTGQFDGGFENAVLHGSALTQTTPDATNWSYDSSALSTSSIVSDVSNSRSGSKSLSFIQTGTSSGKYIMSPELSPKLVGGDAVTAGPSYTVQYYVKTATASATKGAIYVHTRASGTGTQGAADGNGWQKITYRYTGVVTVAGAKTWAGFGSNLAQGITGYIDDFVVYTGTDDNTVPDAPTNPTSNSTVVNWEAPGSGVDGGGYMVVRYDVLPNADNDPNQNGIYAVGNTITNGTGALVGTVVYVGTATTYPTTPGYFYKIYTVDKAFNYSDEASPTLGVNDLSSENAVNVSSNGKLVSVSNVKSATTVSVYSVTGSLVKTVETSSDTSFGLGAGVYVAKVKSAEGEKSVKLLIQ